LEFIGTKSQKTRRLGRRWKGGTSRGKKGKKPFVEKGQTRRKVAKARRRLPAKCLAKKGKQRKKKSVFKKKEIEESRESTEKGKKIKKGLRPGVGSPVRK